MAGYQVITQALRHESPKWDEFAERAKQVLGQVVASNLEISAFFVGDPTVLAMSGTLRAELHREAYEKFRSFVESALRGAETEFPQIGDVLIDIANRYDEAEQLVELDLNQTYSAHQ
ncbi:hypothetical protein ACFYOT_34575 [Saccharothrix saharensis]|uniref:hypothetical protein n=1 Tax=Saccharothrix saharensis TaxID=571190 RepID=UPI0036CD4F5C